MFQLKCDGSSGDVELEKYMAQLMVEKFNLFKKKQFSYGPNNIAALGERGIFVRMWDKLQRLKNLVWDNQPNPLQDESIEDTWGDLGIYAFMAILERQGKWPEYVEEDLNSYLSNEDIRFFEMWKSFFEMWKSVK